MKKLLRIVVLMLVVTSTGFMASAEASFRQGDQGSDVTAIQSQLSALGYNVSADGDFGEATASAVEKFQSDRGIEVDGIIGEETYRALMGRDIPVSRDSSSALTRRIIQTALRYQGVPYVFGGTSPNGFDCSGFTRYVFGQVGVRLPRMADEQYELGQRVSYSRLQPGDLVYFTTYEPGASHVGIYLGDGKFVSATSSRGIAIARMDSGYWGDRYIGARRIQ